MKKWIFGLMFFALAWQVEAQIIRFGLKGGANFSNFTGGVSGIDYNSKTNWHGGAVVQIQLTPALELQPELLFSSQGAEVEGLGDINMDYVALPILMKFTVLPSVLTLDAGPQFSFLMDDSTEAWNELWNGNTDPESFDFGLAAGLTAELSHNLWIQGRYVWGLTEISEQAEVKNSTFQLSLVYMF